MAKTRAEKAKKLKTKVNINRMLVI